MESSPPDSATAIREPGTTNSRTAVATAVDTAFAAAQSLGSASLLGWTALEAGSCRLGAACALRDWRRAALSARGEFLVLAIAKQLVLARLQQRFERPLLRLAQRLGESLFQGRHHRGVIAM